MVGLPIILYVMLAQSQSTTTFFKLEYILYRLSYLGYRGVVVCCNLKKGDLYKMYSSYLSELKIQLHRSKWNKALSYIDAYVHNHKLNRLDYIGFIDYKLLHQFYPDQTDDNNWHHIMLFIRKMKKLGIIHQESGSYYVGLRVKHYSIDCKKLREFGIVNNLDLSIIDSIIAIGGDQYKEVTESIETTELENQLHEITNSITDTIVDSSKISHENKEELYNQLLNKTDTLYSSHYNLFQILTYLEKYDPIKLNKIQFGKNKLSNDEKLILKKLIEAKTIIYNDTYRECRLICNTLKANTNIDYRIDLHIKSHETNKFYFIETSCRQFNSLANIDNKKTNHRDLYLQTIGFNGQFDLHSAIFAVARAINYHVFDADWDIKRVLLNWDAFDDFQKQEFKMILNRCFFTCTSGQSYCQYDWYVKNVSNKSVISKDDFYELFDRVQLEIGGSKEFRNNIFLYESYLELKVMEHFANHGIEFRNVYDCFYFKLDQIGEDEVKNIINKVANEIF